MATRSSVTRHSYLFKNFPQFIVIHTVKGCGIVKKAAALTLGSKLRPCDQLHREACVAGNGWL